MILVWGQSWLCIRHVNHRRITLFSHLLKKKKPDVEAQNFQWSLSGLLQLGRKASFGKGVASAEENKIGTWSLHDPLQMVAMVITQNNGVMDAFCKGYGDSRQRSRS